MDAQLFRLVKIYSAGGGESRCRPNQSFVKRKKNLIKRTYKKCEGGGTCLGSKILNPAPAIIILLSSLALIFIR